MMWASTGKNQRKNLFKKTSTRNSLTAGSPLWPVPLVLSSQTKLGGAPMRRINNIMLSVSKQVAMRLKAKVSRNHESTETLGSHPGLSVVLVRNAPNNEVAMPGKHVPASDMATNSIDLWPL